VADVPEPPPFQSVLFTSPGFELGSITQAPGEPSFFGDLNLDQILSEMIGGRGQYNLGPLFYMPLQTVEEAEYRHEVMRDLERSQVRETVDAFASDMETTRKSLQLGEKLRHPYQKKRWFLDAVAIYCQGIDSFSVRLGGLRLHSGGLRALRVLVGAYVVSDGFRKLASETAALLGRFKTVSYALQIQGNQVRVGRYQGEPDYSIEVTDTFRRFEQGAAQSYRVAFRAVPEMNHVEERILDRVVRLYPELFAALDDYATRNRGFLEPKIARFDREVQFYLAYLDLMDELKAMNLRFGYPELSVESKETTVREAFDLALALKLRRDQAEIVTNDLELRSPERMIVVSGPNQGGKTTFARMFGQLHYLGKLGLPVPAATARLFFPDEIFTHFEREEDIATLRGKLEDELVRIHDILGRATGSSIIVMNESFSSTTLQDAIVLGTAVLEQIIELGALCVCVTFVDELSRLGAATVSMVSTVMVENPAERTFKIERRPADGLAYAEALAKKYRLDYRALKGRVLA
jgi:DNA mismatch repair protein MutS